VLAHPGPKSRALEREGGASKVVEASRAAYYIQGKTRVSRAAIRQRWDVSVSSVWAPSGLFTSFPVELGAVQGYGGSWPIVDAVTPQLSRDQRASPRKTRPDHRETRSQLATGEFHARALGEDDHHSLLHLYCSSHPSRGARLLLHTWLHHVPSLLPPLLPCSRR